MEEAEVGHGSTGLMQVPVVVASYVFAVADAIVRWDGASEQQARGGWRLLPPRGLPVQVGEGGNSGRLGLSITGVAGCNCGTRFGNRSCGDACPRFNLIHPWSAAEALGSDWWNAVPPHR